jgi:hypothetical protein
MEQTANGSKTDDCLVPPWLANPSACCFRVGPRAKLEALSSLCIDRIRKTDPADFQCTACRYLPGKPEHGSSEENTIRCVLPAAIVATLQPMMEAVGREWVFTILIALSEGDGFAVAWMMARKRIKWRRARIQSTKSITETKESTEKIVDIVFEA